MYQILTLIWVQISNPDLLIRTSGERRISNFLLWQLAYAEIHVIDLCWPDFDADALQLALQDYQGRQRRFGGLMYAKDGTLKVEQERQADVKRMLEAFPNYWG